MVARLSADVFVLRITRSDVWLLWHLGLRRGLVALEDPAGGE